MRIYHTAIHTHNGIQKRWCIIMFDVKKPEMTNKTFRLPMELVRRLQEVAQTKGVSLNALVAQCCEYALENLKGSSAEQGD